LCHITRKAQYLCGQRIRGGHSICLRYDPIIQRAYGQLDASIGLTVNKHLKLGIEGVNLLNSIVETSAVVANQANQLVYAPRQWYKTDRRYTISAHLNF
jgi:outer membrane receptor protein involved in Fe transport